MGFIVSNANFNLFKIARIQLKWNPNSKNTYQKVFSDICMQFDNNLFQIYIIKRKKQKGQKVIF